MSKAQSFSVKRAQVEFHNFASLGQPERNLRIYAEENQRRGEVIRNHREFIGGMTPFLEIGANAGHSSYMLANEFGASGFALDLSADSLRHGRVLMDAWGLDRAPVRLAGDAVNLPFADASLRFVCAFQMLTQFMDIESVFREVTRVLQPGGVFLFAEEPLRRKLSLRLYRCAYYETMKPWERKLYDWGLLGYLVRDVIGAGQEEKFGIRQNHSMVLKQWHTLVRKYFAAFEYDVYVPERGWGERAMKSLAIALDPYGSEWRAAHLLGGTLAAVCRKAGEPPHLREFDVLHFEDLLRCPDCHSAVARGKDDVLTCVRCSYRAPNEEQVYNLLPSAERRELYPANAGTSSISRCPDTNASCWMAGTTWRAFSETSTAGSGRGPRLACGGSSPDRSGCASAVTPRLRPSPLRFGRASTAFAPASGSWTGRVCSCSKPASLTNTPKTTNI